MARDTLYWKIYEELKDRIILKKYSIGETIPTENELAKEFNVSLITLRQAIEMLQTESYVEKKRGVGTVVINNSLELRLAAKKNFESIISKRKNLSKKIIDISSVENFEFDNILWDSCTKLTRMYYIDNIPYMYSIHYLKCNFEELDENSLYLTLYKKNLKLNKFIDKLSVELNKKEVLTELETSSALKRIRLGYVETGFIEEIIEYSEMYYNTELYEYEFEFHNL